MLYRMDKMSGMSIGASDGEVGKVKDLYFDDASWAVRYLVVDAGSWLEDRKVLISPFAVKHIDWEQRVVEVRLTREQVRNSPHIDTEKPVSRQHELDLFTYYGYPGYWGGPLLWGATPYPFLLPDAAVTRPALMSAQAAASAEDPHLRSGNEIRGYQVEAVDESIGHVMDFLVEEESWAVRYIVVDTRNWWPGRQVVIPPPWISAMDWAERSAKVNVRRDEVKAAPEFDAQASPSREYEESLHRHYARRGYWIG